MKYKMELNIIQFIFQYRIYRLEAYNSLLKDRLNAIIKKYSNCTTTSISTMRRPASCSNLSVKRKLCVQYKFILKNVHLSITFLVLSRILSEDDLHLLEIPELPTMIASDVRFSTNKIASNKSQPHYNNSQSSIIFENDIISTRQGPFSSDIVVEGDCINNLKNTIHKLEMVNLASKIKYL